MSDLLWLLRWLNKPGASRSLGSVDKRSYMMPGGRWHACAHGHIKTKGGGDQGSIDMSFHAHADGHTPLRALRNLSRAIQQAEGDGK